VVAEIFQKNVRNDTANRFLVGNINQSRVTSCTKLDEFCSWKQQLRASKMLSFALPSEKRLVVSFWTFFKISWQQRQIRKKPKPPKKFVDAGIAGISF